MKKTYTIPKVSKKQAQKNRAIAKIKESLNPVCIVCRRRPSVDPAHLLPRSIYPEYYTEKWNLVGMCRCCHDRFDNNKEFRQEQTHLYEIIKAHDELAAYRYFGY